MNNKIKILDEQEIQNKIFTIRGMQVMLDKDLAILYDVETRRLNEQVKRNIERFPEEFMFQLTEEEYKSLRSQNATLKPGRGQHRKYMPYVFTEQGVTMLSAVLKSKTAVQMSIRIVKAFIGMRKFIAQNAQIFQRLEDIETNHLKYKIESNEKFDRLFEAIESKDIKPKQGIFYNGQIFDAYVFVADLIKQANKSIILIDNYIDESVLLLLAKRKEGCKATIYTERLNQQLKLDQEKHNKQYSPIEIKKLKRFHDRFLILDKKEIYHIGASLKNLGERVFGFSKFADSNLEILEKL